MLKLHELLDGRIKYRMAWAMRLPKRRLVSERAVQFENNYDEDHNFARVGEQFVDDEWVEAALRYSQIENRRDQRKRRKLERWAA